MNAQMDHGYNEQIQEERPFFSESRGSGRVAPQIDPAVILEVLNIIQTCMDGIKVKMEKQANDPPLPTPVVQEPVAPQVPS